MSKRIEKVESLVRQIVAGQMTELLGPAAGCLTITGVDVAPDLHNAIIWVGVLADTPIEQQVEFDNLLESKAGFQSAVAKNMTTKFVPRLHFKLDAGGQYADHIAKLLKNIK